MWVEAPAVNSAVNQTFTTGGWAVDLAAGSGTGVSTLHVWPYPTGGGDPIFLGVPVYGWPRADVAALYGSQFTNSGYGLTATLPPSGYSVVAYAWSTVTNGFNQAQSLPISVATSQPALAIDAPASGGTVSQPFHVGGWAVDLSAPSGTGIDTVHLYAIADGGAGTWTFLGAAEYGGPRPDVAAYFGNAQFTNSGYGLNPSGLAPGYYQINVYAHSTVLGAMDHARRVGHGAVARGTRS